MSNVNNQLVHQVMREVSLMVPGIDQKQLFAKVSGIISLYKVQEIDNYCYHPDIVEKIELYLAAKKIEGLSNKTIKEYNGKLKIFANQVDKKVEDITTNDIRLYLSQFHGINKPTTIESKLQVIKSFFTWLQEEELILKDPSKKIKPIKTEKRLRGYLTVEELELMREACEDDREKALLEILYSTGCRLDEIYKLNKYDIDFEKETIIVVGKGNKERKVYFSSRAKIYLKKYFLTRKDNNDWVFAGMRKPYGRLGHRAIQKIIREIGKRAELKEAVFPHLLRHSIASHLIQRGMSIMSIQQLLGHESIATTEKYAKINDAHIQSEYRKYAVS